MLAFIVLVQTVALGYLILAEHINFGTIQSLVKVADLQQQAIRELCEATKELTEEIERGRIRP